MLVVLRSVGFRHFLLHAGLGQVAAAKGKGKPKGKPKAAAGPLGLKLEGKTVEDRANLVRAGLKSWELKWTQC